jgi:hypothetical protein
MKAWSWKNSEVGISLGLGFHWGFGVIDDLLWSSGSVDLAFGWWF